MNVTDKETERIFAQNRFALSLDQSLIVAMESEARWMIRNRLTSQKEIPDFLDSIHAGSLDSVKPGAVNLIGRREKP